MKSKCWIFSPWRKAIASIPLPICTQIALQNQAEDYAVACKIRALIAAVEAKGTDSEATKEWIAWATAKADWFDPTVAAKDPFFGMRDHRESKDKKQLTEKRSYYFW